MASKEYDVFMEVFTRLSDEVALNPAALANELWREKLIPKTMWTSVLMGKDEKHDKANMMMVCLETKISGDGKVMYQLLSALHHIPDLGGIAKDIQDKLGTSSSDESKGVPGSTVAAPPQPIPAHLNYAPSPADLAEYVGWQVSAKWRNLGPHLGLGQNDMDSISLQENGRPEDCMSRVFDFWMRRNRQPYTWSYLVEVLEKQSVGFPNVAQELRENETLKEKSKASK